MLRVLKWLFILLVVIVGLVAAFLFSKDAIAKAAVEQQLRAQTGMDVKIGKLSLSVLSPIATIENLTLSNPADFGGVPFLNVREMRVEYDREALAHRELKLKLLKMNIAELAVVRNDRGETNIVKFAAAPKPAKTSEMIDFKGIEVANFSISKVTFVDLQNQKNNRQFTWNAQNQVFRNLNSSAEFHRAFVQLWQQRNK
jgi:uncharacterized protein involved in outer membrane biogenesis